MSKKFSLLAVLFCCCLGTALAQVPEWIWHPNDGAAPAENEVRYFRKSFELNELPSKATLTSTGDDEVDVFINGEKVLNVKGWDKPKTIIVTPKLIKGTNTIAIRGRNDALDAAVMALLDISQQGGKPRKVVTDKTWLASKTEQADWAAAQVAPASGWVASASRGKMGVQPWGDILKVPTATPVNELTLLPGFKAELLWSAKAGEGSWICMTIDHKGRLIISPQQNDLPMFRVTLSEDGKIAKSEPIPAPLHQAMGLLYAHDSLYVNGHGPSGVGIYRIIDSNKNDQWETNEVTFLKKVPGEGEHGYHALVLGPDNMIYVMNGNHTKLVEGISSESPFRNYDEDFLLPRQWDAGGHAVGVLAPAGHILRTDAEGKKWELMLGGFRNAYDFDFNADGEMVAFDSDMEWEWGMPWYKPTRILHSVSGADFGWRSGSAKWPAYYADSLPPVVDIGVGSPTGVKFGTASNYPEKYRRALYAMDWSYGRILAVHLTPVGASYEGSYENFVQGKPLNVTDLEFGKDGAMYFITGGRGTQSGLYRVTPASNVEQLRRSQKELAAEKKGKEARAQRRKLEAFHGKKNPEAIQVAWPFLKSDDRWLRYAARVAIEAQEVSLWKEKALAEKNPQAAMMALMALTRTTGKETQGEIAKSLQRFPMNELSDDLKLQKLRVIQLSFIRQGKPSPELAQLASEKLSQQYPAKTSALNRELAQLLIYLEAPGVLKKTISLIESAPHQEEKFHYIFHLRNLKTGWTPETRRQYFGWLNEDLKDAVHSPDLVQWFAEVGRGYSDGASFGKQLEKIRQDAVATMPEAERAALAEVISGREKVATVKPPTKERQFVKEWKMSDLVGDLEKVAKGRNFQSGKAAFADTQCLACHRFGNEGGAVGPELTAASSKYSRQSILESILEPSKIVSEQYQNYAITTKGGDELVGRIVDENAQKLVMHLNPFTSDRTDIAKSEITARKPAAMSPMPEGLVDQLTKEEILDLLAYIEAVGKPNAKNFRK